MASVLIVGSEIHLSLSTGEKFWGFHSAPKANISDIVKIERVDNFWKYRGWHGVRAPGTGIPGVVGLGTWRKLRTKSYCAIYKREPGFKISFKHGEFEEWLFSAPEIPSGLFKS